MKTIALLGQIRMKATDIIVLGRQGRPERCMELGAEITGLVAQLEQALAGPDVAAMQAPDAYDLGALTIEENPEPGE